MARVVMIIEDGPNPYDDDLRHLKFTVNFDPKISVEEFEQCLGGHILKTGDNFCAVCGAKRGATWKLNEAAGARLTAAQTIAKEIINLVTHVVKGKISALDYSGLPPAAG